MPFLQKKISHTLLYIKASPNSAKTKISGKFIDEKGQEHLKINIAAAPEDNKANEELVKFLSNFLKIPKSKIEIIRGENNRMKVVRIAAELNESDLNI